MNFDSKVASPYMDFRFYGVNKPEKGEIVSIIITDRYDTHIEAYLMDYSVNAVISYKHVTTKKRVRSIKKITPLNKLLPAIVEDVSESSKGVMINLNMTYVSDDEDYYLEYKDEQNSNKKMKSIFINLSNKFNLNISQFWVDKIHPIDIMRREENCEFTLYEYFKNNLDKLRYLFEDEHYAKIVEILIEHEKEKIKTYISKFGIISPDGVEITKQLIRRGLENSSALVVKSVGAPYYIVESTSDYSTIKDHENFIDFLTKAVEDSPLLHLKIESTCY